MKKSEYISFRTDPATREVLEELAAEKKWTVSFIVEQIIKNWLENKDENAKKL